MSWAFAMLLATTPANCSVPSDDVARQLALPYEQFDSAPEATAWRQLSGRGCSDAAVELLRRYDDANAAILTAEQRSELAFHRGQVLAFTGRDKEAVLYFAQALSIGGSDEWTTYVAATIAFLRRDEGRLRKARIRYSAIAPGSMREKILAGLEACPGKPYMAAVHCAM